MWPKVFDLGDTLFRYVSAGNLFDKILKQNKNSWDCIVSTKNIETAFTTILPILFLYLNTVIVTAGTFEP